MGNIVENLKKVGMTHSEAGKKGAGIPRKFIIRPSRYCNSRCKLYEICFSKHLSHNRKFMGDDYGKCALAKLPKKIQEKELRFLSQQKGDFVQNLITMLVDIDLEMSTANPEKKLKLFDRYLKLFELVYGKTINNIDDPNTKLDLHDLLTSLIDKQKVYKRARIIDIKEDDKK